MTTCRFIYQFKGKSYSDSLNEVIEVDVVPRVGDTLTFVGEDGHTATSKVLKVEHTIKRQQNTQEITIVYGE